MELEINKDPIKDSNGNFVKKYLRLSAFICGLNPFHSANVRLKSISTVNYYARRFANHESAFIRVHLRLKNIRDDFCYQHLPAPICRLKPFRSANQRLNFAFSY
ncbi:Uncharacterised protein [uncultured archaeon]|nr:Uncharacterised protein [uncultured archaeon]